MDIDQYQYDLRQFSAYTRNYFANPGGPVGINWLPQGLNRVGDDPNPNSAKPFGPPPTGASPLLADQTNKDVVAYLKNPEKPGNLADYLKNPGNPGVSNDFGNPRVKDTFILISAGRDGIYGTQDDITSFGGVIPQ